MVVLRHSGQISFTRALPIPLSLPQHDGLLPTAMSMPAASSVLAVQCFSSTFVLAKGPFHSRCLSVAPCGNRLSLPPMASFPRLVLPGYIFSGKSMPGRVVVHISAGKEMTVSESNSVPDRVGEVNRVTNETDVNVKINLDGSGSADNKTGIPFLDHMLDQLASHGLFDVNVKATGDIHIDDHHTNEDVALAIGSALHQSLGDRKGINRFGDFSAPLDEALVHVSLDLSGRPHLSFDLQIPTERVGTYDTQLVEHFFQSLVNTSGMTLHIRQLAGKNSHHIIEATFKAFARALRQAIEYDLRRRGTIPSSKGILSRS